MGARLQELYRARVLETWGSVATRLRPMARPIFWASWRSLDPAVAIAPIPSLSKRTYVAKGPRQTLRIGITHWAERSSRNCLARLTHSAKRMKTGAVDLLPLILSKT